MAEAGLAVVYVGALFEGSTARHRWQAVQTLTPTAVHHGIDTTPWFYERSFRHRLWRWPVAAAVRVGLRLDLQGVGRRLLGAAGDRSCRLLWLDKTIYLPPEVLHTVKARNPALRIVFYTPDDMANPGNKTTAFLASLPLYDLVVTTKSFQVDELQTWGAREVAFVDNAFDPDMHRPVGLSSEDRRRFGCDVGFCGAFESDRAEQIARLGNAGVEVRVFANDFPKALRKVPNVTFVRRWLAGEEYAKAINGARISLGFLRKANRDLQTTRTVEIPACGGFLLAERTAEHCRLFTEGREAEFFDGFEEMMAKIRYYLSHEMERAEIARAGRRRCLEAGYSNAARLAPIVARYWNTVATERATGELGRS